MSLRRTKIIATIGPASEDKKTLKAIIKAGVDLVRLNMSHGSHDEHKKRADTARLVAQELNKEVGILVDLQGPKIRIAKFKENKVLLKKGNSFVLDPLADVNAGTVEKVGLDYKDLADSLNIKDLLLLDDGRIVLEVTDIKSKAIHTKVLVGGELSNNKGINKQGGGIAAECLTEKDFKDIEFAKSIEADYLAVSFVKTADDIEKARGKLPVSSSIGLIAKIECKEALNNIEDILHSSDALMVARGDLGVEIGVAEVPGVQKRLIRLARSAHKAVITATQMMESMIVSPIPTRAEVSDVANAVLDGTDAVMLSAETAVGANPIRVVEVMADSCSAAESQSKDLHSKPIKEHRFRQVDEAIAFAAMFAANQFAIQGLVALTETGTTPLLMSRVHSGIPVYGISRHKEARRRMTLYRGVYPIDFDVTQFERWEVIRNVLVHLRESKILASGNRVIVTRGDIMGVSGRSNAMKILTVE